MGWGPPAGSWGPGLLPALLTAAPGLWVPRNQIHLQQGPGANCIARSCDAGYRARCPRGPALPATVVHSGEGTGYLLSCPHNYTAGKCWKLWGWRRWQHGGHRGRPRHRGHVPSGSQFWLQLEALHFSKYAFRNGGNACPELSQTGRAHCPPLSPRIGTAPQKPTPSPCAAPGEADQTCHLKQDGRPPGGLGQDQAPPFSWRGALCRFGCCLGHMQSPRNTLCQASWHHV